MPIARNATALVEVIMAPISKVLSGDPRTSLKYCSTPL